MVVEKVTTPAQQMFAEKETKKFEKQSMATEKQAAKVAGIVEKNSSKTGSYKQGRLP